MQFNCIYISMATNFMNSVSNLLFAALAFAVNFACTSRAYAHGDVWLTLRAGRLTTGLMDFDEGAQVDVRVFGAQLLGETPFNAEPGFVALAGNLPPGLDIAFAANGLRYWNGSGSPRFDAPPDHNALNISLGPLATTVTESRQFAAGFAFAESDASGSLHEHLNYALLGPARPGIYLVELQLRAPAADYVDSPPFWLVMNFGLPAASHQKALDWTRNALPVTPFPGDDNLDGVVDLADLNAVRNAFGMTDGDHAGDVNDDGRIDLSDLNAVRNHFGGNHPALNAAEPNGAALLLWGVLAGAVLFPISKPCFPVFLSFRLRSQP
jgi:hypothetical protein